MAGKLTAMVCVLVLPLLTGMRDPFRPLPDRCQLAQWDLWHLQGVVLVDGKPVGIGLDPSGRWRRVRVGDMLFAGWRIVRLNKEEAVLENADGCSPTNWRWKREGTRHDKSYSGNTLPLHRDDEPVREAKRERKTTPAGHSDGGRRAGSSGTSVPGGAGKT